MPTESRWRLASEEIIADVIERYGRGSTRDELKGYISAEYPFGERAMWPYKVWLDEVRRQLDRWEGVAPVQTERKRPAYTPPAGQMALPGFGEATEKAEIHQ